MKLINTIFAHGHGPYLRTCELAIATGNRLYASDPPKVVVPLVYGNKQINILKEQFAEELNEDRKRILLDETAGQIIYEAFFKGGNYFDHLAYIAANHSDLEGRLQQHFSGNIELKTLDGKKVLSNPSDIIITLSRDALLHTGLKTVNSTCGPLSEIINNVLKSNSEEFRELDLTVLEGIKKIALGLEKKYVLNLLNEPFAFSYMSEREPHMNEIFTPPMTYVPKPNNEKVPEGIYVSVTGIEGLAAHVTKAAKNFNLKLYCPPQIKDLPEADNTRIPEFIINPNIKYVLSRGGWGAGWLALLSQKPWLVVRHLPSDDPEMYFVEKTVETLGLGVVFDSGQDLTNIIRKADALKLFNIVNINEALEKTYGTRNGITYMSKIIADYISGKSLDAYNKVVPALQGGLKYKE